MGRAQLVLLLLCAGTFAASLSPNEIRAIRVSKQKAAGFGRGREARQHSARTSFEAHRISRLTGHHTQRPALPARPSHLAHPVQRPSPRTIDHVAVSPRAAAQASAPSHVLHPPHAARAKVQQQQQQPATSAAERSWSEDKDSELEMEEERFLQHESPRAVHDCGLFDNDCNFKGTGPDRDRGNYMKARPQSLAQVPSMPRPSSRPAPWLPDCQSLDCGKELNLQKSKVHQIKQSAPTAPQSKVEEVKLSNQEIHQLAKELYQQAVAHNMQSEAAMMSQQRRPPVGAMGMQPGGRYPPLLSSPTYPTAVMPMSSSPLYMRAGNSFAPPMEFDPRANNFAPQPVPPMLQDQVPQQEMGQGVEAPATGAEEEVPVQQEPLGEPEEGAMVESQEGSAAAAAANEDAAATAEPEEERPEQEEAGETTSLQAQGACCDDEGNCHKCPGPDEDYNMLDNLFIFPGKDPMWGRSFLHVLISLLVIMLAVLIVTYFLEKRKDETGEHPLDNWIQSLREAWQTLSTTCADWWQQTFSRNGTEAQPIV